MAGLSVVNVSKSFGETKALDRVDLRVLPGQVAAILGPSGCGKSTLLNIIAGLEKPDTGHIYWNDLDLSAVPVHQRGFGLMFQDYALFPHLTVFENVAYGLRMAGHEQFRVQERVNEVLSLVGLEELASRDVNSLSGGEQQRVALARSLAPQPALLMLDEPLGALDRSLRERLVLDLRTILRRLGQTALYVTHDQEEAFSIADSVVVLNQGRVEQVGSPFEIYQKPHSVFVARFLGMTNMIPGTASGNLLAETSLGMITLPSPAAGKITILLRPDKFSANNTGPYTLKGNVVETVLRGPVCRAIIKVKDVPLTFDFPPQLCLHKAGSPIELSYDPAEAVEFWPTD
jgi:ABC-type Fe3+/spermidine/putrescine transport system ATPase subunit